MRKPVAFAALAALLAAAALSTAGWSADQATLDLGKKEEQQSCVPCHSLRLIHSQRLSRAAWGRELDKMTGWGTEIRDRDALLEYLSANYGDDKPIPAPAVSQDGTAKK
jgi:mono/diheme cytochrome c family protein